MLIQIHDSNHFVIGCDDKELLENIKEQMGGAKVRRVNQTIVPLRSGPKIYRFKKYGIRWGEGTKTLVDRIQMNAIRRKRVIAKIKNQYGKPDIKFEYDCKGIYTPLQHQKIMFNMMVYPDVSAVIADTGTCKTGPYLWAIDERKKRGQVKKALIITMSDLKENVLEEMSIQVPHLTGIIIKNKNQANKLINKTYKVEKRNLDYDIYICNYEKMFSFLSVVPYGYFDMVVLDEAHRVGSPGSRQTKDIVKFFEFCKYKNILTGTLTSNNLMSFYMPFRFLGADTVPYAKYWEFRRQYMHTVDPDGHIWKSNHGSEDVVSKIIGGLSVQFKKEECLDLPPLIREKYLCDMDPGQNRLYIEMKKDMTSIIEDMCKQCDSKGKCNMCCEDSISASNALVLAEKLRQIASGFYINTRTSLDENGKEVKSRNVIYLNENPKLRLLINVLNNIPADRKVIIWSCHIPAINLIKKAVGKAFGADRYLTCYQDQNAFEQIQKFKDPQYSWLIGNPTKMGHGHNIQFSNYMIFFNNSYSYIYRDQAEGRQYRQGQTKNVTVIDLATRKTVDEIVLKAIARKVDLSLTLSQWARVLKKGPDGLNV